MDKTIGFFTVATGDEHYYRLAQNLLRSYRYFSKQPLPFALLADRKNAYTQEFDDVIIMENTTNSYLDKLSLYDYLPYDISVFIDADCLAYGDLNEIPGLFEQADDFCCFGRVLPLDDKTGWFNYEDLGDLQSRVHYCVGLHGGIYYIRRTEKSAAVFETAKEIAKNYHRYNFKGKFSTPGDEPIIALSMALNECRPIPHDTRSICCYWEHENRMDLSMEKRKAWIRAQQKETILVHWGTRFTRQLLYKKQLAALELLRCKESAAKIWLSNVNYDARILAAQAGHFAVRVKNKLKRMLHIA
ncbi:MAG: hypothetical protein IKD27_10305 [Oscillospiraceae bacterium]|nr:hypothetical protein [Oscillospiraceae bacterium]